MVGELAANEKALAQTGHGHRPLRRHVLQQALERGRPSSPAHLKESLAEGLAHGRICWLCPS